MCRGGSDKGFINHIPNGAVAAKTECNGSICLKNCLTENILKNDRKSCSCKRKLDNSV